MPGLPAYDALRTVPRDVLCGLLHERGDDPWAADHQHRWERDRAVWDAVHDALAAAAAGRRPTQPAHAPPAWLGRLVRTRLETMSRTWTFRDGFLVVRLLERLDLVEPERDDTYVLAVVGGLGGDGAGRPTRADVLRSDPELVSVLPRLFEVEGGGEVSLANIEKFSGSGWHGTVQELVADGTLQRRVVMAWCLMALQRDFSAYRAGWYAALYRSLQPSPDEQEEDQGSYRVLLGSRVPATVSLAARYLRQVSSAGRLDVSELDALAPALLARTKSAAIDVLDVLAEVARLRPDLAAEVTAVASSALGHSSRDVQRAAAKLLTTLGAESAVQVARDQLAPAVRSDLGLHTPEPVAPAATTVAAPQVSHVRSVSAADLRERTAALLESAADPVDVELVLGALATLPDAAAAVAPLARRARTVLDRGPREGVARGWLRGHLARLVLVAAGEDSPPLPAPTRRAAFLLARVESVARVLSGAAPPYELLATPTTTDGLLDPEQLAERVEAAVVPETADVVAALLRLAPDGRSQAMARVRRDDELGRAVRYGLGGPPPADLRADAALDLWVAAARARSPREDDELLLRSEHTMAGAGHAVRPALTLTGEPFTWQERGATRSGTHWTWHLDVPWGAEPTEDDLLRPTLARSAASRVWPAADLEDWVGWLAATVPLDLETALTELCGPVLAAPAGWGVLHDAGRVLTAVAGHPGAAGPLTAATLAAGLAATRVDHRVLAVDAVAVLAVGDRLTAEALARGAAALAPMLPAPRLAGSFGQLAAGLGGGYVADVLTRLLPELDRTTRGLHVLLDVLRDETVRLGRPVDDPALRAWLTQLGGSGRAATAAKALLAP